MWVRAGAPVAVVAATVACATFALAGRSSFPGDATLKANGESVRVEVGTFCALEKPRPGDDFGNGLCADAAAPTEPPEDRLVVGDRDRVRIRFERNRAIYDGIRGIAAATMRIEGGEATYLPGNVKERRLGPRRWILRLPRSLGDANALEVFVALRKRGDASYLAGLRPLEE